MQRTVLGWDYGGWRLFPKAVSPFSLRKCPMPVKPVVSEHWKSVWGRALANMPIVVYKNGNESPNGSRTALMRFLGLDMSISNPWMQNYRDYHVVYEGFAFGVAPKDPEIRRKLEICAGPYGKLLAWIKLNELGLGHRYKRP